MESSIQRNCVHYSKAQGKSSPSAAEALNILWTGAWLLSLYHSGPWLRSRLFAVNGILPLLSAQLKFAFRNWQRLQVRSWEGSVQVHKGWKPFFAWRGHGWGTPWGSRGVSLSLPALHSRWLLESGQAKAKCRRQGGRAALATIPPGSCNGHFTAAPAHPTAESGLLISKHFHIFSRIISLFALSPSHWPLFPSHKPNKLIAKWCVYHFYNNVMKHLSKFIRTRLRSWIKPRYTDKCCKEQGIGT